MDQNPIFVPGKIYIRGLSPTTRHDELRTYFSKYGKVKHCAIREDPDSSRNLGFGFITFKDHSVVDRVIVLTHVIDGHPIKVERCLGKKNVDDTSNTNRLDVFGIPGPVSAEDLAKFFSDYGGVISCSIERDKGRGCIFFESPQQVDNLLARFGNWIQFPRFKLAISKHLQRRGEMDPSRAGRAGEFGVHDPRRMAVSNPAGGSTSSGQRDASGRVVQNQLWQPYGSYGNICGSEGAMVPSVAFPNSIGYGQYYNAPIDAMRPNIATFAAHHLGQAGGSQGASSSGGGAMRPNIATFAGHRLGQNVGRAGGSQGASSSGGGALYTGHHLGQNVGRAGGSQGASSSGGGALYTGHHLGQNVSRAGGSQGASSSGGGALNTGHRHGQNVYGAGGSQGASSSGGGALNAGHDNPYSLFSYPIVSKEMYRHR